MRKLNNDKPFGNKIADNFNIGDLVKWTEWGRDKDNKLSRYTVFGVLVNIIHRKLGERDVIFATVLPSDESQTIEVVISKLRKL